MDGGTFDRMMDQLSRIASRRATLGGLSALAWPGLAAARKRKRKRRKRKNKKHTPPEITPDLNEFGCVNVGGFCQNSNQCCSGICQGEKDQKTCQAHNIGTCQGEDACVDDIGPRVCTMATGTFGFCHITTGQASYCGASVRCHACTQDTDCVSTCGAGAACVVCADSDCLGLGFRTACASTVTNGCYTTI